MSATPAAAPDARATLPHVTNFVNGRWVAGRGAEHHLIGPADGSVIGSVTYSTADDVNEAVAAAADAFRSWREVPIPERVRLLFALRERMNAESEALARLIVLDEGKTLGDARGEVRRALESVEVACGVPLLSAGDAVNAIADGVDSVSAYYPVGVCAIVAPFNFPLMVPLWFLPYALGCGNTVVLKPSEQVPLAMERLVRIIEEIGFPPGVVNMVQGGRETVDALITHPDVAAVSFVGSEAVAEHVYRQATHHGKRAQCLGGAKNFMVIMPDADVDLATNVVLSSAFGAAGERCLAGSMLVPVGSGSRIAEIEAHVVESAAKLKVGSGDDPASDLGPLVSQAHRDRVLSHIGRASEQGAQVRLDGRPYAERPGFYLGPTVIDRVGLDMGFTTTEVFGPVLGIFRAGSVEEALAAINASPYGNAVSLCTSSGGVAREFVRAVPCGMVGVNIGVPAPMAYFPFTGWRRSFFGDLNAQGRDSVRFFTRPKVVISRWR